LVDMVEVGYNIPGCCSYHIGYYIPNNHRWSSAGSLGFAEDRTHFG